MNDLTGVTINRYPKFIVLLAAGLGTRLRPYTYMTPKPLLKVDGIPILLYYLNEIKKTKIKKIVIITNHLEKKIKNCVESYNKNDFDIIFLSQNKLDGSAGALKVAKSIIKEHEKSYFIVSATDYLIPKDFFMSFIDFHKNGNQDITAAIRKIVPSIAKETNITTLGEQNRIINILEKPDVKLDKPSYISSYLLYILPTQGINYLDDIHLSKRNELDLAELVNIMIREKYRARGYLIEKFLHWEKRYLDR